METLPGARRSLTAYHLDDVELGMGASFGNASIWINTKNTGAIERVFCLGHGQSAIGSIITRYAVSGTPADSGWHGPGRHASSLPYIPLRPDGPLRRFELHPAYQRCDFSIARALHVSETTFVPLGDDFAEELPVVYQRISVTNLDESEHRVRIMAFARLRGSLPEDVIVRFDEQLHAFVAWNRDQPLTARYFGFDVAPTAYETSFDFGSVYDPSHADALNNNTLAQGDVLGCLQLDATIKNGKTFEIAIVAAAYAEDAETARARFTALAPAQRALPATVAHLERVLARSHFLSPDSVLNDGALWSKVNMRRVMGGYPQGPAFTNDPGASSNVVVRDAAWFVYGNDHFMPEFSRALIDRLVEVQYSSGKMPEYYDALTGRVEDDGLNVNDGTPLFILAVHHHFNSTGDTSWAARIYPAVAAAARYIISQLDERGLVFCDARDPRGNVWAIASWRNIIAGYSINGAVTEVNAECVAALRTAADMAQHLGSDADSADFAARAEALRESMDRDLVNPETGLYYLNIDVDGNKHTDVTGDLIFPVIFNACDEDMGFRIISRLNAPDFATSAGLRTVSRNDPRYDPVAYAGLLGGVWPGLTWWYAFGAARYQPDAMVKALRSSFEHYSAAPRKNNTVPGQFSEFFNGESLVNMGMRLSPWEPPRFLWAAVEGVCGITLSGPCPRIEPLIPEYWRWVALRNLPYHGSSITYAVVRQQDALHVYATGDVKTSCSPHIFDEDVSARVRLLSDAAVAVAFRTQASFLVFVGSVSAHTTTAPLELGGLLRGHAEYRIRIYNSQRDAWDEPGVRTAAALCSLAISIEARGFRLIELEPRHPRQEI